MSKVVPIDSGKPSDERVEACLRAYLVFECLPILAPKADADRRRRLADEILSICRGTERRVWMTPELLAELVAVHSPHAESSAANLCWEINKALGVANDEDKGVRRLDEMCAAKPLDAGRFDKEE